MNKHQLLVQAYHRPEVLERILRVVRHRGFRVNAMNMEQSGQEKIDLYLTVSSERPLHLLTTQLDKLMDVDCVDVQLQTSQLRA
jgi:acetolactate synthase II small subunit